VVSAKGHTAAGSPAGIQWQLWSNEHLEDLDFADDIALLSTWRSDMQSKINALHENAGIVGLNINVDKTKGMAIGSDHARFTLEGNSIESADSFTYLGSQLVTKGSNRFYPAQTTSVDRVNLA
jgi:hypothetical protein